MPVNFNGSPPSLGQLPNQAPLTSPTTGRTEGVKLQEKSSDSASLLNEQNRVSVEAKREKPKEFDVSSMFSYGNRLQNR